MFTRHVSSEQPSDISKGNVGVFPVQENPDRAAGSACSAPSLVSNDSARRTGIDTAFYTIGVDRHLHPFAGQESWICLQGLSGRLPGEGNNGDGFSSDLYLQRVPPISDNLSQRGGATRPPSVGPRGSSCSGKERSEHVLQEKPSIHGSYCGDFGQVAKVPGFIEKTRALSRLPTREWMDLSTTVERIESVLGRLERGGSSGDEFTLPAGAHFRSQRFVRVVAERMSRPMRDAQREKQDSVALSGYVNVPARGNHCLIDVDLVEAPERDTTSVANPLRLLLERESATY